MTSKTKVRSYTDKQLLNRVRSLANYKAIPDEFWILGVRSKADTPNVFDDKFYLARGEKFILVTTGTTNAGLSVLQNGWKSINKDGAFVLKSNMWFYNFWELGKHKGVMKALVQVSEAVGYRDNNNNDKSEETGKEVKGWFGINFHCNSYNVFKGIVSWLIGGWSAGCQVCNNLDDYYKILDLVSNQKYVTYCLIYED